MALLLFDKVKIEMGLGLEFMVNSIILLILQKLTLVQ